MPSISEARLRRICRSIILAMNTPEDIADVVTDVLVSADVKGVDSHGCRLLKMYKRSVENGSIIPSARPEVMKQEGAIAQIEGHWGWGHVAARQAAGLAAASARTHGIGAASVVHVQHIGRVGEYSEIIARNGMLGIVTCNTGPTTTPYGGMSRTFGTNPIAMAAPRSNGKLLSVDFATSAKSVNKLQIARQHQQALPEGVILDKNGYATTDSNAFFDAGVLLPFGSYKGYAFNLFIDIIGGILVGAGCGAVLDTHPGNGTLCLALDIAHWRSPDDFANELEDLLARVKGAPVAPGFDEVLLPGELETRAEEQRKGKSIPLDQETWDELKETGKKLGVPDSLFA